MNGYCVIKANTIMSLLQILLQIPTVFRIKSKTQLPLGPLPILTCSHTGFLAVPQTHSAISGLRAGGRWFLRLRRFRPLLCRMNVRSPVTIQCMCHFLRETFPDHLTAIKPPCRICSRHSTLWTQLVTIFTSGTVSAWSHCSHSSWPRTVGV